VYGAARRESGVCSSLRLITCRVIPATERTHPANGAPASAQISLSRVHTSSSAITSRLAPVRSLMLAAVTTTASSNPSTSTAMCRFRPLIFFTGIEPARTGGDGVGGLDRLRVHDRRAGPRVPASTYPQPVA
jgi:hypothetical protein